MANPVIDHAGMLEILRTIERLGGSASYKSNPQQFDLILFRYPVPEVSTSNFKERNLEVFRFIQNLSPDERVRDLMAYKRWLSAHLQSDPSDEISLELLRNGITILQEPPQRVETKEERFSRLLKGIEMLGGSVGYERYVETPQAALVATIADRPVYEDKWDTEFATANSYSWLVVSVFDLQTITHSSEGTSWGLTARHGDVIGLLHHAPWSTLISTSNYFGFGPVGMGAGTTAYVELMISGITVAKFWSYTEGEDLRIAWGGSLSWNVSPEPLSWK